MDNRYRLLLLTSIPGSEPEITAIAAKYFANPTVLFWEMGNLSNKADVLKAMDDTDFNLIISYISGIILKSHHLQKATYGAINIHPAPPEHGGCWGIWCQPVVNRDHRTHHGVTVHEVDAEIDHGPIYLAERWEVPADATIQSVYERSVAESTRMLEKVCAGIAAGQNGTKCFTPSADRWDPRNRHTPIQDIRGWFARLDPKHPAHGERVFLNHPRAVVNPPYFDDL
jgi:methionyl-tRNA formyltransferase